MKLLTLSEAEEFSELRLRSGEKGLYKEINKGNDIRFPLKMADISLPSHKVYIIIQAEIGAQEFPLDQNFQKLKTSMLQDRSIVFQHCHRIISSMIDCLIHKEDGKGLINALGLARCLRARVWEGCAHELRQLEGLGPAAVRKMIKAGVKNLRMMEQMQPHQIESALSRNPPFGTNMLKIVKGVPKLTVAIEQVGKVSPVFSLQGRLLTSEIARIQSGFNSGKAVSENWILQCRTTYALQRQHHLRHICGGKLGRTHGAIQEDADFPT